MQREERGTDLAGKKVLLSKDMDLKTLKIIMANGISIYLAGWLSIYISLYGLL